MAKRRKAPKRTAVSESEDEAATEVHEPPRRWQADQQHRQSDNEAQKAAQSIIDDLEAAGDDAGLSLASSPARMFIDMNMH